MIAKSTIALQKLCLCVLCGAVSAALLVVPSIARAEVASLTVVADTFINNSSSNNNAGRTGWFDAGTDGTGGVRRGLFRFDVSSIPAGSTITSAVMQLTVTKVPGTGPVNSTFDLFRLLASWNEGTKGGNNGANASAGEVTWNARLRGTADWTTPGAKSDAVATASASTAVTSARNARYSWNGAGLVADVQFWVDNPSENFGWLLTSRSEGSRRSVRGFTSREGGANAGTLVVNYDLPAPAPNLPPTVSITSPADGATFISPASVTIEAAALDADGTVTKVEFLDGADSLGSVTASPFATTITLYAGVHTLTAVATDDKDATATSEMVTIDVNTTPIENPIAEPIVKGDIAVELLPVVEGLSAPLGMAVPDDGSGRMFVYDQAGLVWVVTENASKLPTPLLDVSERLVTLGNYDERGLLGFAVHPGFMQSPFVYTYTSEPLDGPADFVNVMPEGVTNNHQSVIAEWRIDGADANRVDPNSRRELLRIDQPQSNHNGGTLRFGPDGFLYVSLGDGGRANDVADGHVPGGNAQNLQRIYGSVVRIDVDGNNSANGRYGIPQDNPFVGQDAVEEIYAYGLRNPYTYSFDSLTGELYLGDAGQNNIEEVDIIVKGGNYGWNLKEGSFWFDSVTTNIGAVVTGPVRPVPADLIDPVAEYDHDEGAVVVGGYVYRGSQVPALQGRYVFGDWGSFGAPSARLFTLDPNSVIEELHIGLVDRPTGFWLRGFGQDADGELYVFGSTVLGPRGDTGQMLKIVPSLPLTYVPHNLVSDVPDVADFTDPNLVGPWGIAADPNGLLWIANNRVGLSTVYDSNGMPLSADVIIPPPAGGTPPAAPTGIVFNSTEDFVVGPNLPAEFIYATADGAIISFSGATGAVLEVDNSTSGAVYTGIALGNSDGNNYLYVANFSAAAVDVFDSDFNPAVLAGSFSDPNLPVGFAPFNIRNVNDRIYVTYALRDIATDDAISGPGNGYVNVFDPNGQLVIRLMSQGPLDAPWGLALAPGGFGGLGGALIVGNFGDGRIHAFNPETGEWLGELKDADGITITIEGLRGLAFGNSIQAGNVRTLYFTATIPASDTVDAHSLLGRITPTGID
ncbi:MAG: TIGR03118 family protein [Planctomycetes bacterium RBG_16_55_9]|nr:MAG: TIGR03118 family protein [Planctomycetes bacterium RBG_16_55_9]